VRFCYHITNTGAVSVSGITVTDALVSVPGALSLAQGQDGYLMSSAEVATLNITDQAVATGAAGARTVISNQDAADVIVPVSDLSIQVTASLDDVCGNADDTELATVLPGTPVYYCYQVNNVGQTAISHVTVNDPLSTVELIATIPAGSGVTFISAAT